MPLGNEPRVEHQTATPSSTVQEPSNSVKCLQQSDQDWAYTGLSIKLMFFILFFLMGAAGLYFPTKEEREAHKDEPGKVTTGHQILLVVVGLVLTVLHAAAIHGVRKKIVGLINLGIILLVFGILFDIAFVILVLYLGGFKTGPICFIVFFDGHCLEMTKKFRKQVEDEMANQNPNELDSEDGNEDEVVEMMPSN